jgi:ketosteroid isomerase-like protein
MLTIEDRLELQDLYSRYSRAADDMDGPAWADCWAEDGEFTTSVGPTKGTTYRGRKELEFFASTRPDNYTHARIWTNNHVFEVKDGYVEGRCYGMTIDMSGDRPVIAAHFRYLDEIMKVDGRWKFRRRRPTLDVERGA